MWYTEGGSLEIPTASCKSAVQKARKLAAQMVGLEVNFPLPVCVSFFLVSRNSGLKRKYL